MIVAWLAFYDSLLAVALVAAGMTGAHWRFFSPFVGFQVFVLGFLLGIVALLLGIIGIFATRNPMRAPARPRAVIGTVLGLIVAGPIILMILTSGKYPAINDITTDTEHPPEFAHAGDLNANHGRDMKYDVAKYAAKQQQGYGQLDALKMPEPPDDAFKNVSRVASQMPDWTITNSDSSSRTIEGYSTSRLFHFNDDFVIQVRAGDGGGSLLEMRSKSRDGIGDFGVNYTRIKTFFATVAPESKTS
jgi:uncharacterized protein (DUF1499 family)